MVTPDSPATPDSSRAFALRGLAVDRHRRMNVHPFALPAPAYYNPLAYGATGSVDYRVGSGSFVFIPKTRFAPSSRMLFGVGA